MDRIHDIFIISFHLRNYGSSVVYTTQVITHQFIKKPYKKLSLSHRPILFDNFHTLDIYFCIKGETLI